MSEFIEQDLVKSEKDAEELRRLFQVVFWNGDGQRLLGLLNKAVPPMRPRFDPNNFSDTHGAAFRDGQADVVGFLWRYGAQFKQAPTTQEP